MTNTMTLEQVVLITAQLPLRQQLQLVARISERLSALDSLASVAADEAARRGHAARAEAVLALCDDAAERFAGESDSAEEIRRIRDERIEQLC